MQKYGNLPVRIETGKISLAAGEADEADEAEAAAEGKDAAAVTRQRGLGGEFCGVKYVMKSFAGPLSSRPCLGCLGD